MELTLKNIKHSEFASHETPCYEASVYLDGKKIGNVSNDGNGGCDQQHIDKASWPLLAKYFKTDCERDAMEHLETFCMEFISRRIYKKDMKSVMKRKAIFQEGKDLKAIPLRRKDDLNTLQVYLEKKYRGTAKLLNIMPEDEALNIWINHAES